MRCTHTNKIRHRTWEHAYAALAACQRAYRDGCGALQPYRCNHCGDYHLGRLTGKGEKKPIIHAPALQNTLDQAFDELEEAA